jgi:hypothetical protein
LALSHPSSEEKASAPRSGEAVAATTTATSWGVCVGGRGRGEDDTISVDAWIGSSSSWRVEAAIALLVLRRDSDPSDGASARAHAAMHVN